jgi:16S rRNA (uracil1498-N3)-methyltransferase
VATAERVVLLVGPEGGFSDEEFAQLKAAGVTLFCFAPHVLRVETAAVVGAAMIRTLPSPR